MDYFKKIFNKDSQPKTQVPQSSNQTAAPVQQTTPINRTAQSYPVQNYSVQTNQPISQPKDMIAKQPLKQPEGSKVNLFSAQPTVQEQKVRPISRIEPTRVKDEQPISHSGLISQIVPPQHFETTDGGMFADNRRMSKNETGSDAESMKRIITKMSREEATIIQKLEGLEKRNFPNAFPNQPSFPDSFPNALQMKPVSNEQLHNFSKQRLDFKKQQKEVFVNYKQETDFYRRFLPMNEQKKLRLHQEINELQQRSTINDKDDGYNEDMIIQQELAEIERLKQLAMQDQNGGHYQNAQPSYQNNQPYQNMPLQLHDQAKRSEVIDYNPYSSQGYQQNMKNMSGNYQNDSQNYNYDHAHNHQQSPMQNYNQNRVQNPSGHYQPSPQHNNQAPYSVNDNFNPNYNLTAFINKNVEPNNKGIPVSQRIDSYMNNNSNNYMPAPPQNAPQQKPRSNINSNNPLLNII